MSQAIEKFEIRVDDAELDDLKQRLERTRWPDQIPGSGWGYGTDLAYLQELCAYWCEEFDWRAQEALLNRFEHYRTQIDGENLHFLHARSSVEAALPLVITHGWPGSVFEFYKIIGPLTDPEAHGGSAQDAFHVVCPSMPGYGFSGPTTQPGWDVRRVAEIVAEQILLGQPLKPVCREDCAGLCQTCGVNRNRIKCGCRRDEVDPRLAPLLDIKDRFGED